MPRDLFSNTDIPQTQSLADSAGKWGQVRAQQMAMQESAAQQARAGKVREYYQGLKGGRADPSALSAIDPEAGAQAVHANRQNLQYGQEQVQASREVASHFISALERKAQASGVQPGTPQYQQLANETYRSGGYGATMQSISGKPYNPAENIDVDAAKGIAGPSAAEQEQGDIEKQVRLQQALQPGKLEVAQAQAGLDRQKQDYVSPMEQQKFDLQKQQMEYARQDSNRNFDQRDRGIAATAINKPLQPGSPQAMANDASEMSALIGSAMPLLKESTGSGMGSLVDKAAGFAGVSMPGADVAAKLKVIGGTIVSKMPKPPGAASDRDMQLAAEQAGQLGDPTVPPSQKIAALESLKEINQRQLQRAGLLGQQPQPPQARPGFKIQQNKRTGEFREVAQ
jgi:hypothetical protein